MPGYELLGQEELAEIHKVFDNGAVLLRHGFAARRRGLFMTQDFEHAIAGRVGASYCLAVSSATVALKIALLAVGVRPGDEVVIPAFTFIATAEAVMDCGAVPVFANIDQSLTLDPDSFEQLITERTRAVMPVHMIGQAANLTRIKEIASARGIPVVEDAAQAFGAEHAGRAVGTHGLVGVYSFDYNKTLTTGEGGAIVTDDPEIFRFCLRYHDHGHVNDPCLPRGEDRWDGFGFNYRLSEVSAAIGLAQLSKLDDILKANSAHWTELERLIEDLDGVRDHRASATSTSIRDCYVVTCATPGHAGKLAHSLADLGVQTKNVPSALKWHFAKNWHHLFELLGYDGDAVEQALRPSNEILSRRVAVPINVHMTSAELAGIAAAVNEIGRTA